MVHVYVCAHVFSTEKKRHFIMSGNTSGSSGSTRNGYIFPDFPLRRLFLQTRAGRSSYTSRMCDVERGSSSSANTSNSKSSNARNEKSAAANTAGDTSSNRVSSWPPKWQNQKTFAKISTSQLKWILSHVKGQATTKKNGNHSMEHLRASTYNYRRQSDTCN